MAVETTGRRSPESAEQTQETWRRRTRQARSAQEAFHGTWATNLAFSAGQQWLVWDKNQKKLRSINEVDDAYANRELFTANRIREFVQAQLGELASDDERPELLVAQEGEDAEQVAKMLNRIAEYAWDHEWDADSAVLKARRHCLDLGVAAIRCRWNPNDGALAGHAPLGPDGQPINDQAVLQHLEQHGALPDGSLPRYKPVREGRTVWETYSAFQLLTPPGVVHEDNFPWEGLVRAVPVEEIEDTYGVRVREDTDIANSVGLPSASTTQSGQQTGNRLRDHAWLYTCFDKPNGRYPEGRSLVFAGASFDQIDEQPGLPYKLAEQPHTGIVYFHWWRLSDRFQSQSFVEPLKDPQRVINKRRVQKNDWIDRSMPKLLVRQGDFPGDTTGASFEIIELAAQAQPPTTMIGPSPGSLFEQDVASLDEDLSHASTLSLLRLGENPQNVATYGQLALLNDNEHGKRQTVQSEHRQAVADLVELSVSDIQKYWPDKKRALLTGDDDRIEQVTFEKSMIPAVYRVKVAKGAPQPRSQGAQIKKIEAIFAAAEATSLVAQDPAGWTAWYKDSIEAGSAQDLPVASPSSQQQLAHLENLEMRQGQDVEPSYYDQLLEHLPVHREEEDQARAAGDMELAARIDRHIIHSMVAKQQGDQMLAQVMSSIAPPPQPGMPMAQPPDQSGMAPPGAPPGVPPGAPQGPPPGQPGQ